MREGTFTFFIIEFRVRAGIKTDGSGYAWRTFDVGMGLFDDLPYADANGELGDYYRGLLDPTHAEWQVSGHHGFQSSDQAFTVMDTIVARKVHTRYDFRVSCRTVSQVTTVVER